MLNQTINKISRGLNEVLFSSFPGWCLSLNKLGNIIIMYHGVDLTGNTRFNNRHAGVKCFEAHIRFLKKYCHVIPLLDFFSEKFRRDKINVAITFDDGYVNNFKYALPVLEKYATPASFFITGLNNTETPAIWADILNIGSQLTDRIKIDGQWYARENDALVNVATGIPLMETIKKHNPGFEFKQKMVKAFMELIDFNRNDLHDYWKLMSDEQIRQASKSKYIEIGSHAFFHNNLGNIPHGDACDELRRSKSYLENISQKEVVSLAYPDSSYTRAEIDAAESIGFKYQLAGDGFLFPEDKVDSRIRDRAGIYNCGRCGNQLFDAMKRVNNV